MLKINNRIMIFLCIRFVHFVWCARRRINIFLWFSLTLLPFYCCKRASGYFNKRSHFFTTKKIDRSMYTIWMHIWMYLNTFRYGGLIHWPRIFNRGKTQYYQSERKKVFPVMNGWHFPDCKVATYDLIQHFSVGTSARIMT